MTSMSIVSLFGLSVYIAIASSGAAGGFLLGYWRCRSQRRACQLTIRTTFGEKITRLVFGLVGGVVSAISGHFIILSGAAQRLFDAIAVGFNLLSTVIG
jgi:hypothetical protein